MNIYKVFGFGRRASDELITEEKNVDLTLFTKCRGKKEQEKERNTNKKKMKQEKRQTKMNK